MRTMTQIKTSEEGFQQSDGDVSVIERNKRATMTSQITEIEDARCNIRCALGFLLQSLDALDLELVIKEAQRELSKRRSSK